MTPVANTPADRSNASSPSMTGRSATALPGVLVLASDGTATLLNSQAEALWGVPATAVLGHVPAAVRPAHLPPELLHRLRPLPIGMPAAEGEHWLPHTGQWVSVRTVPAPDGTLWVYWENITAQKAGQEAPPASSQTALQQSHERLVQVLESTSDAFYALDAEWRFTYVNQRAAQLWGREPGTLLGQPFQQAFPQSVGSEAYRRHQEVLRGRQPAHFETVSPILGIWIDASIYPSPDGGLSVFFRDISARKRAEEALRQSEEKFRLFVTTSSDTLYRMSPDWRQMLTLDGQNFLADTPDPSSSWVEKYLPPEDQASTWATIHAAIANRQPFELEHRVYRADGSVGWTHSRAVPVLNAQGDVVEWFGAATNITARKQAEAALAQAHERLQLAMNVGRIFSFEMDPATRALELSDNTDLVMGFPLPDHIDSTFQLIHPDDLQPTVDLINGAIDSRGSYASEYRLVNPANGEVVWFHSQAAFSRINGRDEWRFVGIAQNITERKRAAEALRASEEKYRSLFETMDQGFAVCELVCDETGQAVDFGYLELNPAWEQQTGMSRELALRSTATQLVPGLDVRLVHAFARVVETGEPTRFDYYVGPMNRWYHYLAFPQGGQRFAVLYDDITARKQAEEALRQSEAQQAFLVQLGDALRPLTDAAQVQAVAARVLGQHLRANQVHYGETQGEDVVISQGYGDGLPAMTGRFRAVDFGERHTAAHRAGIVRVISDIETDPANTEAERQVLRQAHIGAYITVPLLKEGQWVATLAVHSLTPRSWTVDEVRLVEEVAERTWAAVERARAEEALQTSEQRLSVAIEAADMATWNWNVANNEVYWNDQHFALFGREPHPGPVSSEDFARQLHPDDREWVWQRLQAAVAQQHVFEAEFRVVRADNGETRWMSGYGQAMETGPAGDTRRMSGVMFDITARKRAEQQLQELMASLETQVTERTQALRDSQELLQLVFDTSPMCLSVQQAVRDEAGAIQDFQVLFLNKELARELGRADMVGKHYVQEYPGMTDSGLFGLMRKTVETGEPQHMEYYYPFEGFNRWFASSFVKLNDGVVATTLDITPRKRAEEERFRNFSLLQQSEEVAGIGSWDYHVATGAFRWSDGMYRLFDLPLGTPVTPDFYLDVAVAEDYSIAERLVHKLTQEPSSFEKQLRVRIAGQVKTLRLKAEVLRDATGQPERVLGVDLDISAVQRLEADNLHLRLTKQQALFEAVQQAEEMERKRIAEGLHNGIGQLLYATKLRLDRLQGPVLSAEAELAAARREADRLLAEAIRQTRVLSHELVPRVLEDFGLERALHDVCQQLSTPPLRMRCHVALDEESAQLPPLLQLGLYRIAQELGQNIVRHAHGATEASLELESIPGFVLLRAEDNGPGFAADATASTGLGLRTIRDRVALLNGTLEQGNRVGSGSYVRLRIPVPVAPPA